MLGVVWSSVLLVGVLLAFAVILWYVRSVYKDSSKAGYKVDIDKLSYYIRRAKEQESHAWSQALSVMAEEKDIMTDYQTAYVATQYETKSDRFSRTKINSGYSHTTISRFVDTQAVNFRDSKLNQVKAEECSPDVTKTLIPPTFMQLAFFNFWKVPAQHRPPTAAQANQMIESYKIKLKGDGFTHRVHRWNRLELMMGRFCSDYDVAELNKICTMTNIEKPTLDLLLDVSIQLLSKKELHWKDLVKLESYHLIVKRLGILYPQLELDRNHR